MTYDLIIIGAGPAGTAAAVYAARKRLKVLMITDSFGGQSIVSNDIQNWIGEHHITGLDLAQKFEDHVRSFSDAIEIKMPEKVASIRSIKCLLPDRICDFEIKTDVGNIYESKTLILAMGARRKRLGIPGEDKFEGKGVAFCSTCDAPLFGGKNVAVVGGGNAGLEAVTDLFPYAEKIYLLVRSNILKGDPVTQEKVKRNPKLEIIFNAVPKEIFGDKFVSGIIYTDSKTNGEKKLNVDGVFVEIGSIPNSDVVTGLVEIDKYGQVITNSKHASTSNPGIFAAGDITDDPYKQNNISAGDGVRAALAAYSYLQKRQKHSLAAE